MSTVSKNKEGDLFRQGNEINDLRFAVGSNVPLMCLNHNHITKFKKSKVVDEWFDDSTVYCINDGSISLPEGNRIEQPNFRWESKTLGYVALYKTDTPFEDLPKFNAVDFVKYQNIKMYPEILDNPSFEDPYFLNGIIDVFNRKTSLAGKILFDLNEPGGKSVSASASSINIINHFDNHDICLKFEDISKPTQNILSSSNYTPSIAKSLLEDEYVNNVSLIAPPFNETKSSFISFKNKTIEYRDSQIFKTLNEMTVSGSNGPVSQLKFSSTAGWVREGFSEPDSIAYTELKR